MAYALGLDVVGCLGSSIVDATILLEAISGHDRLDSTSRHREVPSFVEPLLARVEELASKPLAGVKFGLLTKTLGAGVEASVVSAVQSAARYLEDLGAIVVEVLLSTFSLGLLAYYVLAASKALSNLSRYDGARYGTRANAIELTKMYGNSRSQGLGAEVKRLRDLRIAFEDIDVLLSPVTPTPTYKLGEKVDDPLAMYAGDLMIGSVNLAGLPTLVVPCGLAKGGSAGLPIGLQMIGKSFEEGKLLWLGHLYEQTAPQWCANLSTLVQ